MKNSPLISIIIVNWNGKNVLNQCFKSLQSLKYPNWELILVDNGSIDGSQDLIKRYRINYKKFTLIQNKSNLGFAEANNQGFLKSHGKYILLLNNDTKMESDSLFKLVNRIEQDNSIGIIQPKILLMDKPKYLDNVGAFLTKTGFLEHWGFMKKDGTSFNQEQLIFSAKGACMLIRKKIIDEIGLFDQDYISYMEETDFCWRVWIYGYRVLFFPEAKIYHQVGATSKKQNQVYVNYHAFKNRINSLIKNLELGNLFLILTIHLSIIAFLSLYYLLKFQFSKTIMIWKAIGWNIIQLPMTLQKRSINSRLRCRSDNKIFPFILHPLQIKEMFSHFSKVEANFKHG